MMNEIVTNQGLDIISTQIFKQLDPETLDICRVVSKEWKKSIESKKFYWFSQMEKIRLKMNEKVEKTREEFHCCVRDVIMEKLEKWCDTLATFEADSTFENVKEMVKFMRGYIQNGDHETPLEYAGKVGNIFIVKYSLWHNFDFNFWKTRTCLHNACIYGHIDIVKLIFKYASLVANHNIDFNATDCACRTAFHHVCEKSNSNPEIFDLFLDHTGKFGIKLLSRDADTGYDVNLNLLNEKRFIAVLKKAKELNIDLDDSSEYYHGLQHKLIRFKSENLNIMLDHVKELEIDINAKSATGSTPILYASELDKWSTVELYLKTAKKHNLTLDFEARSRLSGQTISHLACWKLPLLVLITKYSKESMIFDTFDKSGWTPLHHAVRFEQNFEYLMEHYEDKIDWFIRDLHGRTLLHSSMYSFYKSTRYFFEYCHELGIFQDLLNCTKDNGGNALHEFPQLQYNPEGNLTEIIEFCQEHGYQFNFNTRDAEGNTLLHTASKKFHRNHIIRYFQKPEILYYLDLANEIFIDFNATDAEGRTVFYLVGMKESECRNCHKEEDWFDDQGRPVSYPNLQHLIERSLDLGINLNIPDNEGLTLLHWLCKNGKEETVALLIQFSRYTSLDFNVIDKNGRTPFHYACEHGWTEIVKSFLMQSKRKRISINSPDFSGKTPLHLASIHGKLEAVSEILKYALNEYVLNGETTKIWAHVNPVNTSSRDELGKTALDYAKENKHAKIIKLFQIFHYHLSIKN